LSHAAANDFFNNVKYPGRQLRHISANETVSCKASLSKKGRTMSSEQMRVELESFVNKGLKEGWRGWPLKSQPPCRERFHNLYSMAPLLRLCQAKRRTLLVTVEKEQY